MTGEPHLETYGFPPGYFIIRSVGCNRLLDVTLDEFEDGTEIALWPEKDKSIVETRRSPEANNQVFFIDTSGALCSRSSGHAIDVEGDALVLRHRRPVSYPFPNAYSHPLPRFSYSQETGEITVHFTHDPSHPPPYSLSTEWANTWERKTYLLASVPLRKPRTILDDAHAFLSTAISTVNPLTLFSGAPTSPPKSGITHEAVVSTDIDLGEDEVLEEERGEEAEVDDSAEWGRKVKVLGIIDKDREERGIVEAARMRRKWQITSLRATDARTGEGAASEGYRA
ncbi:hypothetical protein MIND_00541300 [Mycena indigotica]|uniref:Uncharacterized protein n=1 Tax=Mycena indigotica TaxID=2126181 RepID=A0A8H6W6C1_9AGAR|nr:uncharacterized protein MIND_00541300 [Mycena indigotica]KAF7307469.1 hypothetical protein MIND_00541300 [Mycena indigotica]